MKKKYTLMRWFKMKEQEVLNTFASLPNAIKVGDGDRQFVYIPGTKENKVLLVAHADTTNSNSDVNVEYKDGKYFSKNGCSIGADDRAGCAILWNLRDSGHSILVPNGEESGCIGSDFLMESEEWRGVVEKHNFAIEFDRMHENDLVFYNVGSPEFIKWCEKNFTGYKESCGSFTDICKLCKKICGVNISVGYYGQHSNNETLIEKEWHRTLRITREVLARSELPRFERKEPPPVRCFPYYMQDKRGFSPALPEHYKNDYNPNFPLLPMIPAKKNDIIIKGPSYDWLRVCIHCKAMMDISEYTDNKDCCIYCKKGF